MTDRTSQLPKRRGPIAAAAAVATLALLAACGGGGGDAPAYSYETAEAPPEGSFASISNVLQFIVDLAGSPLEGREPFNVDAFAALGDSADTLEPQRTSIDQ